MDSSFARGWGPKEAVEKDQSERDKARGDMMIKMGGDAGLA